jgi:hypothetical protein
MISEGDIECNAREFSQFPQSPMQVIPTHLQSQPHQMRPMWTASKILRSPINGCLPATAPADERAAPDEILARSLSAYGRDERRISCHCNGVTFRISCWDKAVIELVRIARRPDAGSTGKGFSGAHWVCRADFAPRAQKIRRPSSGGGLFRGDFLVREIALPHIDPFGSRHLAVSNDRLPDSVYESLLMLETINNEKRRLVNFEIAPRL